LASIIEKRRSLHSRLKQQQQQNDSLEKHAFQLESLANLGSAAAMIAHELNNLLTPLSNYAELALQNPEDRVLTERALRKTAQNSRQAAKVMESILSLANIGSTRKVDTPLLPLVRAVFDCLCRDFHKDSINVDIRINPDLPVWVVPVQLQQAIMNLVLNARESMLPKGGALTIEANDVQDNVQLVIKDTGSGIDPVNIKNVFDSFFTTKHKNVSNQSGTGLGLALCKKVVDHHNGSITVESRPGAGSTFTILLPKKG
jgi:two-component system NtrC family sensor kinase